mmetsp:Transcript_7153/g.25916  ORF Transcript_7153/g.25916 Transcript_7153/m.25916 type:complete len:206 (-) Transcript_7153:1610-2227(-)
MSQVCHFPPSLLFLPPFPEPVFDFPVLRPLVQLVRHRSLRCSSLVRYGPTYFWLLLWVLQKGVIDHLVQRTRARPRRRRLLPRVLASRTSWTDVLLGLQSTARRDFRTDVHVGRPVWGYPLHGLLEKRSLLRICLRVLPAHVRGDRAQQGDRIIRAKGQQLLDSVLRIDAVREVIPVWSLVLVVGLVGSRRIEVLHRVLAPVRCL